MATSPGQTVAAAEGFLRKNHGIPYKKEFAGTSATPSSSRPKAVTSPRKELRRSKERVLGKRQTDKDMKEQESNRTDPASTSQQKIHHRVPGGGGGGGWGGVVGGGGGQGNGATSHQKKKWGH